MTPKTKKLFCRLYLIGLHLAAVLAIASFVWVRFLDRGLPVSIEWMPGFDLPSSGDPTAEVAHDYARIMVHGGEIAQLKFEDRQLVSANFGWPGENAEWALWQDQMLFMPTGRLVEQGIMPDVNYGDLDGDRILDIESRKVGRGRLRSKLVFHPMDHAGLDPLGLRTDFYNSRGEIAARSILSEDLATETVEYLREGETVRTLVLPSDQISDQDISDEVWDAE